MGPIIVRLDGYNKSWNVAIETFLLKLESCWIERNTTLVPFCENHWNSCTVLRAWIQIFRGRLRRLAQACCLHVITLSLLFIIQMESIFERSLLQNKFHQAQLNGWTRPHVSSWRERGGEGGGLVRMALPLQCEHCAGGWPDCLKQIRRIFALFFRLSVHPDPAWGGFTVQARLEGSPSRSVGKRALTRCTKSAWPSLPASCRPSKKENLRAAKAHRQIVCRWYIITWRLPRITPQHIKRHPRCIPNVQVMLQKLMLYYVAVMKNQWGKKSNMYTVHSADKYSANK